MTEPDLPGFYKTINNELMAIKNRLGCLVSHPGEKGRYVEAILKSLILKFLPKKYSIGTGFVMNKNKEVSTQIDIIVYDNSFPVLFSEEDFVVVLAASVKAIIEVKTSITNTTELKEIIKKSEENGKRIKVDFDALADKIFNGIFCYECELKFDTLQSSLKDFFHSDCEIFFKVSNISLGNNKFLHIWWDRRPFELKGYKLNDLSFSFFISNLLTSLDPYLTMNFKSLFFPLDKEPFTQFCIKCDNSLWDRYPH